jgi:phenylacetic acid degradation operon negative regulatory protein
VELSARHVVLEVLSAWPEPGVDVPVRLLVRAGEVFGIAPNSVRVALNRLRREGRVASSGRGMYRLGAASTPVHRRVVAWHDTTSLVRRWDGTWLGVHGGGLSRSDRAQVRRRERALRLWGFRPLRPGLDVRPANLLLTGSDFAAELVALGLDPDALLVRICDLGSAERQAMKLWNRSGIDRKIEAQIRTLERSEARLSRLSLEAAVREVFLKGRASIRQLVLDPLLPEPMVDVRARVRLVKQLKRYERLGVGLWKRFFRVLGA